MTDWNLAKCLQDPANILCLCSLWHRWITEHPAASDSLGFTRPSWDGGDAA